MVMDRGEVREFGTHQELLQHEDGLYRNLYEKQFAALQPN
jgi:ABC-type multidrug transport system fused ATPase/permease subunit